jgi:hypothetical protein
MTLSPPSNVKLSEGEAARVLSHGIDTLVLAINVEWADESTFETLATLKAQAKAKQEECTGLVRPKDGTAEWVYTVKPHGGDGYEWLLTSGELAMRIGKWLMPGTRPSVMVEIRSEALWMHGPVAMVERVLTLLKSIGANVKEVKVSRADLCVDVLLPARVWGLQLLDHLVTRADTKTPHIRNDDLV